jgi:hypothetical protein
MRYAHGIPSDLVQTEVLKFRRTHQKMGLKRGFGIVQLTGESH